MGIEEISNLLLWRNRLDELVLHLSDDFQCIIRYFLQRTHYDLVSAYFLQRLREEEGGT